MQRQRQALRDQPPLAIADRRRKIHVVLEDAGIGRANHRQRHLIGYGHDRGLEQLERDRIVVARHGRHSSLCQPVLLASEPSATAHQNTVPQRRLPDRARTMQ